MKDFYREDLKEIGLEIKDHILIDTKTGKNINTLILPEKIEYIAPETFKKVKNLEKVVLPESLKTIGYEAFNECKNLEEIVINKNLESIYSCAFSYTKIKSLNLPKSFKTAGDKAFAFMTSLEDVKFENKNTEIKQNAFGCCKNLKNVILPKNLKVLQANLFFGCIELKNIEFGDIEEIESAFFNTLNLTKLILPKSLKALDENFVHVDPCLLPDDENTADGYTMEIFSYARDSVNEIVKENKFANLHELSLDKLLDTGKSFKQINDLYKGLER